MDKLQIYLDSVRSAPFEWGVHDCALFAARGADAAFGTRFTASVLRFNCHSAKDYRRMQREGASLEAMTTAEVGEPLPEGAVLLRGDVVLISSAGRKCLGLAVPPVVVAPSKVGFIPMPVDSVTQAWRIG